MTHPKALNAEKEQKREQPQTLAEQTGKTEGCSLRIGPYVLSRCIHGGIWIEALSGEGGQFNEKDLAAVIHKFYDENF